MLLERTLGAARGISGLSLHIDVKSKRGLHLEAGLLRSINIRPSGHRYPEYFGWILFGTRSRTHFGIAFAHPELVHQIYSIKSNNGVAYSL